MNKDVLKAKEEIITYLQNKTDKILVNSKLSELEENLLESTYKTLKKIKDKTITIDNNEYIKYEDVYNILLKDLHSERN